MTPTAAPANGHRPHIRSAVETDRAFIASTWAQNFWRESSWANRIRWPIFNAGHAPIIRRLLERSAVLVACDPIATDEIAGYLVYEPPLTPVAPSQDGRPVALLRPYHGPAVHFAYVKPAFRRAGVLRSLLAASELPPTLAGVAVTHGTRAWFSAPDLRDSQNRVVKPGRPGLEEKFPGAVHDPYRWMVP